LIVKGDGFRLTLVMAESGTGVAAVELEEFPLPEELCPEDEEDVADVGVEAASDVLLDAVEESEAEEMPTVAEFPEELDERLLDGVEEDNPLLEDAVIVLTTPLEAVVRPDVLCALLEVPAEPWM
jgi:hypothetical protein